jgi:nucleotide-binding universal stress UspA family protein
MLPLIRILGVGGYHKTDLLKDRCKKALVELEVDLPIVEVTDLEEMVASKIAAIPALIVNEHVLIQGEVPLQSELQEMLANYLFAKVVVPVDFSESSKVSLSFAEEMAKQFYLSVKVLHVYGPVPTVPEGPMMESATEWLDGLHEDMRNFIDPGNVGDTRRSLLNQTRTVYEIRSGDIQQELRKESRYPDTRLIVMANSGDHDLGNRWFGSTATAVARNAECPVMLVPGNRPFTGFKRVTVATDQGFIAKEHIRIVDGMVAPFNGTSSYIHVDVQSALHSQNGKVDHPENNGRVIHQLAERVEDGLLEYANKNNVDLIVLIAKRRRAWQELFHRSCTKHLAEKCPIPILVLPPAKDRE